MEIVKNSVVKSIAGHDKGSFYMVLDVGGGYATIADGRRRPVERPKRKSERHLAPTQTVLALDGPTNKQLWEALRGFNLPHTDSRQGGNVLVKG